jgi:beta-N-acetylhexosaminidase
MTATLLMLGVAGPELTPEEEALFRELRPAGFILHSRNLASPAQTRALTDSLRALGENPPLITLGLDEALAAAGPVLHALPTPPALAARNHAKTTGMAGRLAGEMLRLLGVNLHLGPHLDLIRRPAESGAESRWGSDCQAVIDHAGVWNRWFIQRGPLACARNFPGCGSALTHGADGLPVSEMTIDELLRADLLPFTALMPEFHAVLTGHVRFPRIDADWPASLSPRIIRRLLRDQLGFDHHLAIAAELDTHEIASRWGQAEAARLAIEAGNDLAIIGRPAEATVRAAAAAIAEASAPLRHDALARLERIRWRAPAPLPWSEDAWRKLGGRAAELRKLA